MSRQEKHGRGRNAKPGNTNAPAVPTFASISPTPLNGTNFREHNLPSQSKLSQSDLRTNMAPPAKIARPASKGRCLTGPSKSYKKQRTPHACDCCQIAKAGCNGEQPCDRCRQASVQCKYSDFKRDHDRKRLSNLSKEIESLTQHKLNVTNTLRRIRWDAKLSINDMRAAIGKVIDMAPVLPYENEEPASEHIRALADCEELVTSPTALSSELDFLGSASDSTTAIQMLGDLGWIYGYYEDPWQHSGTPISSRVPFPLPVHESELLHGSMQMSGGS